MYKCPNCHKSISGNVKSCPKCGFELKITLEKFKQKEEDLQKLFVNKKFKSKKDYAKVPSDVAKFDEFINRKRFITNLQTLRVSGYVITILKFKMLSKIYLNALNKNKRLEDNIRYVYFHYYDSYNENPKLLATNLDYLSELLGYPGFSETFIDLLRNHGLTKNEGKKIYGFLIWDILSFKVKNEQEIEKKLSMEIKNYASNRKSEIQKKIKQYYQFTGKNYFSKDFQRIMDVRGLSVTKAFKIKENVLKDIYSKKDVNVKESIDQNIKIVIKSPYTKRRIGSQTKKYTNKVHREYEVLGDYK